MVKPSTQTEQSLTECIDQAIDSLQRAREALCGDLAGFGSCEVGQVEAPVDEKQLRACENEFLSHLYIEAALQEMTRENLLTNDIVTLRGGYGKDESHKVAVNGFEPVLLNRREFLVALVLFRERRKKGGYLTTSDIIKRIDAEMDGNAEEGYREFWPSAVPTDIYRIITELRGKLVKAGCNGDILEAGQRGTGYRLSTVARNVQIELK
jgi:hypothetical protein